MPDKASVRAPARHPRPTPESKPMGKVVRCPECSKVYRDPDELEELRDNDSICLVCNAPIEVSDWDRILASWEDEEDLDDVDDELDDDWSEDDSDDDEDFVDDEMDDGFDSGFDDDDGDDDEEDDDNY